jgi:hypothetical protein
MGGAPADNEWRVTGLARQQMDPAAVIALGDDQPVQRTLRISRISRL